MAARSTRAAFQVMTIVARNARLRRQLAPLSPEQRGRVLHSLEDDTLPEAREIARLLLRDFRAAEVSPSLAPAAGRGTEPAPIAP